MTKPTEKDTHGDKSVHDDKSKGHPSPDKGKPAKLRDDELDKVAGGIGGLGKPIPVKR